MSEYDMIENIAGENTAAREHGTSVAREYERVVNTFNKVLLFKEKIRLSFEHRICELDNDLTRIEDQLGTLLRNIEIYELNISRSSVNLEELLLEETHAKEIYNSLLQGTSVEPKEVLSVVERWVTKFI